MALTTIPSALSPADVVIRCGAYQAFGTDFEAQEPAGLGEAGGAASVRRRDLGPDSTDEQLASMWPGMTAGDCIYLPDLVDAATAEGFCQIGDIRNGNLL